MNDEKMCSCSHGELDHDPNGGVCLSVDCTCMGFDDYIGTREKYYALRSAASAMAEALGDGFLFTADEEVRCPSCGEGYMSEKVHAPDCKLAAALDLCDSWMKE